MRRSLAVTTCVLFLLTSSVTAKAEGCTDGMWLKIKSDLEWTVSNAGAKNCVYDKMLKHGENAYTAFSNCNDAFRDGGLINPIKNDYKDCAPNTCNWFVREGWSPPC